MKRPTLALCAILKNEAKNLPRFLHSVEGCFDEIHLTDTGSTDESVSIIKAHQSYNDKLFLHHFEWCDDFALARNASFAHASTDYIAWLDLDDVLHGKEAFLEWRDNAMALGDFWLATYHYALDNKHNPLCSFARERIVKKSLAFEWKYFVHEGMLPTSKVKKNLSVEYATTWSVHHLRDEEDVKQDRSRNLRIFEKHKPIKEARMRYYYGKELFENQKPLDAFPELMEAMTDPLLEGHDRVMAIQYACASAMALNQLDRAITLAHQGLAIAPQRAEFFIIIADCHGKSGRIADAVPYYEAATKCAYLGASPVQGPTFQNRESYQHYPLGQLARIYAQASDLLRAEGYCNEALRLGKTSEIEALKKEILGIKAECGDFKPKERIQTSDIVITTPPQGLYEWDEDVYKEKGIGGSETAAVEMARHLAEITGRKVIVFNPRTTTKIFGKVEYRPCREVPAYFRDHAPALHVGWRHALKFSTDPLYAWCHDLGTHGIENPANYHKALVLSDFHKGYVKSFFGVPEEKIIVTKNGLEPKRFEKSPDKIFGKVIFSSSPDRGLDRAIRVMREVVKMVPDAELHCFYGFDNMRKMGLTTEVERLERMVSDHPFVKFHGNVTQARLTEEMQTSSVWLYPTNFAETYCITAIEALSSKTYPVAREWGALQNTLRDAADKKMATLISHDCETEEEVALYADATIDALLSRAWERMEIEPKSFSWESVAHQWVKELLGG